MEKVKLLQLLIDILNLRDEKITAVKSQRYEEGTILRDRERILERMFYKELMGYDDNYQDYVYSKYTESIKNYLKSEYNLDYNDYTKRALIREIKLMYSQKI